MRKLNATALLIAATFGILSIAPLAAQTQQRPQSSPTTPRPTATPSPVVTESNTKKSANPLTGEKGLKKDLKDQEKSYEGAKTKEAGDQASKGLKAEKKEDSLSKSANKEADIAKKKAAAVEAKKRNQCQAKCDAEVGMPPYPPDNASKLAKEGWAVNNLSKIGQSANCQSACMKN